MLIDIFSLKIVYRYVILENCLEVFDVFDVGFMVVLPSRKGRLSGDAAVATASASDFRTALPSLRHAALEESAGTTVHVPSTFVDVRL